MKISCGAILYSYDEDGNFGLILGYEDGYWLPFKGGPEINEIPEQTAIREIYEETCGLVKLNTINLEHRFMGRNKRYYIGLCEVPYSIVKNFKLLRSLQVDERFIEKKFIKFFPIHAFYNNKIHNITKKSIYYYWDRIEALSRNIHIKPGMIKRVPTISYEKLIQHHINVKRITEKLKLSCPQINVNNLQMFYKKLTKYRNNKIKSSNYIQ